MAEFKVFLVLHNRTFRLFKVFYPYEKLKDYVTVYPRFPGLHVYRLNHAGSDANANLGLVERESGLGNATVTETCHLLENSLSRAYFLCVARRLGSQHDSPGALQT